MGDYTLLRRLGSGGMGEVFAARHDPSGEPVALKVLSEAAATRLYRFKREFRTLADVSHPNLVELRELVVRDDLPAFFTMELLDGRPFVEAVREGRPAQSLPDLERMREGLRQLVGAVAHLHERGYVHRDLKPANVLLTARDRVVVLDFGLVAEAAEPESGVTRDGQLLGTPRYMAPEQALGHGVGPPADLYAVGVMLFECLRGGPPHQGTAMQLLLAKQSERAPDPGPQAPAELRRLCRALLAKDPDARPSAAQVLDALGARASLGPARGLLAATAGPHALGPHALGPHAVPFVGREGELLVLARAYAALSQAHAEGRSQGPADVLVHVSGPSGHGKSHLLQQACAAMRKAGALVLHGRCRQREAVPYKGLDAVVDGLSAHLRKLAPEDRDALRPPDADVLARVFPVLDELWTPSPARAMGPAELRRLGAHSLGTVLRKLAQTAPLVIHVDDLQWADHDTVSLLEAVARPEPGGPLALLLSYRSDSPAEILTELLASPRLAGPSATTLVLEALSFGAARELASLLLGDGAGGRAERRGAEHLDTSAQAEAIAMRARGSPFYITQLAHKRAPSTHDSDEDLDRIVARRLSELPPQTRGLLEVVAVFGGPLPAELAIALARERGRESLATDELDSSGWSAVDELCDQGLLVRASVDGQRRVELAHDRVREVAIAGLGPALRASVHWRLGQALRERHAPELGVPELFMVAEHLAAGLESQATQLRREQRLELVTLEHLAGRQSLEAGAWIAARRYLRCAHGLITPWLDDARAGAHPDPQSTASLCAALTFALAQAEFALDPDRGLTLCRELMSWELDAVTLSEALEWHNSRLMLVGAWEQCVEPAVAAARRLGFRVPRMSLARSVLSYALGWRALQRAGLLDTPDLFSEAPALTGSASTSMVRAAQAHERERVLLNVVGTLAQTPVFVDLNLSIWAYGQYGRLLARHGAHESMGVVLVRWAISASTIGRREQAKAMAQLVLRTLDSPRVPVTVAYSVKPWLALLLTILYPLAAVAPEVRAHYQDVRRVAPQPIVEISAGTCCIGCFPAAPLTQTLTVAESARGPSGQWEVTLARGFLEPFTALLRAAAAGEEAALPPELADTNELSRGLLVGFHVILAVARGDSLRARALLERVPDDYGRAFGPMPTAPLLACASVIALLDDPTRGGRPRGRLARRIRGHRRVARKWAKLCDENYGACALLIEAELGVARGDERGAMELYEQAIAQARTSGLVLLTAVASHRLGRLALRRGNSLMARAALDGAKAAHRRWEHAAGVRAIEAEEESVGAGRTSR